jgi:Transposase DDE domain group 1
LVWYKGFLYQAASWKTARHVVAKVEFHAGELFPRVGFIVTNLETDSRTVVRFDNKRGTAEQWIKEGKQAVKMTRLSCRRFRSHHVRLALSLLAFNLGNLWRRLTLPNHEFTATTGEDGRTAGETCLLLLALAGGEPSDKATLWEYGAADRGAVASGGIAEAVAGKSIQSQEGTEGCLTRPDGKGVDHSFGTRVGAEGILLRALGPSKENNYALEAPKQA